MFALLRDGGDPLLLVVVATLGNTLGAVVNWTALGVSGQESPSTKLFRRRMRPTGMKKFLVFLLMSGCLTSSCSWAAALDDVLSKHKATLGSLDAWRSVNTLALELRIIEPTFDVTAVYRVTRSRKMRIDIFAAGQRVFTEAFDGSRAWQWSPGQAEPAFVAGEAEAALRHGIELPGNLYTLFDMESRGHEVQLVERDRRADVDVVRVILQDGFERDHVIDRATGEWIASRDVRAFHPDFDAQQVEIETRRCDFREVHGMRRNLTSISYDLTNDRELARTRITAIAVNPAVDESYFSAAAFDRELTFEGSEIVPDGKSAGRDCSRG